MNRQSVTADKLILIHDFITFRKSTHLLIIMLWKNINMTILIQYNKSASLSALTDYNSKHVRCVRNVVNVLCSHNTLPWWYSTVCCTVTRVGNWFHGAYSSLTYHYTKWLTTKNWPTVKCRVAHQRYMISESGGKVTSPLNIHHQQWPTSQNWQMPQIRVRHFSILAQYCLCNFLIRHNTEWKNCI